MYGRDPNNPHANSITNIDIYRLRRGAETPHLRALIEFMARGARVREIASGRRLDIDVDGRVVNLTSKNGTRWAVPLTSGFAWILLDHVESQDEGDRLLGWPPAAPDAYLFRSAQGGATSPSELASDFVSHALRTLGRAVSPHAIRLWALRHKRAG